MGLRRRLHLLRIKAKVRLFRRILRNRTIMKLMRRWPRFARLPGHLLIVHHADARRALKQDRNFGVPYLAKMEQLCTPFVLGLDDSPDYQRQRASLEAAVGACDHHKLAAMTGRKAEEILAACGGRIEIVRGLTDPVLGATIGAFLGIGPVSRVQLVQARTVFHDVFINSLQDPTVSERAQLAGLALRAHVRSVVDDRQAEVEPQRAHETGHPESAYLRRAGGALVKPQRRRGGQPGARPPRRLGHLGISLHGVRGRRAAKAARGAGHGASCRPGK